MCWGMGLFLGAGVVRGTIEIQGQWAWRMPYALQVRSTSLGITLTPQQWVWPVPLFLAVFFAPESKVQDVTRGFSR